MTSQTTQPAVAAGGVDIAKSLRPRLQRAPLAAVAVAMMLGVTAGRYTPAPAGAWAVLGAICLAVAAVSFPRPHLHQLTCAALAGTVLCLGAVHVRLAYFTVADDHVVTFTREAAAMATIRGQIVTSPVTYEETGSDHLGYRGKPKTGFLLQAHGILVHPAASSQPASQPAGPAQWATASGQVRVTIREPNLSLAAGQEVELVGWLGRFRPLENPGQFDSAAYGRDTHTLAWMTVSSADGATVLAREDPSWLGRALWHFRSAARQHLNDFGDVEDGQLLNALIIGERHPSLRSLNKIMMQAGVVHYLSISGSHLAIFLGMVYLLCRIFTLTPRRSAIVVLSVLSVYMVLAEPNAPLFRSAIMAGTLCLAAIFQRRYSALNALAASMVILLAADPLQLFSAGFQLSFALVGGFVILNRPVRQMLFGRWLRRRGLMVFRGKDRVRRWLHHTLADWLIMAVTINVVAFAVSVPLVAYHFRLFSAYAPLLSALLSPMITMVLVPGYLSAALAWPAPNLSAVFGNMAATAADWLARVVEWMKYLPGLCLPLRPVNVWLVVLAFAAMAAFFLRGRTPFPRVTAALAAAAVLVAGAISQWPASRPDVAELNLLAVGAGQCAVLRVPSGQTYLLDAGTRSAVEPYDQVLDPFLRDQRLPCPRSAFVSHANTDHFNALTAMVRQGEMECVYLNESFGGTAEPADSAAPAFANLLGARGVRVVRLHAGMKIKLDDRTYLEVLWPPPDKVQKTVNDTSLVLKVTCDDKGVIVPGDVGGVALEGLLSRPAQIKCDALVLPHHGSWETGLHGFVKATGSPIVLASCARQPQPTIRGGRDAVEYYRHLATAHSYYATYRNGWCQVRFGRGNVEVRTMRP